MQLSYNVIKNDAILTQGNKTIKTDLNSVRKRELDRRNDANNENIEDNSQVEGNAMLENYEALVRTMVDKARRESEQILFNAYEKAKIIEEEAYSNAYQTGSEQGYRDAYEQTMISAKEEANMLITNANDILFSSKAHYEKYMEEKKDELIELCINISKSILKRELNEKDAINEMLKEALADSRDAQTFVIKTNSVYADSIKDKISYWKESLGLKGEIFVISDETIEVGNVVIEKNNGKIKIGIDAGLEAIRQALL